MDQENRNADENASDAGIQQQGNQDVGSPTVVDPGRIAALRTSLGALEGTRPHDHVKVLVELAEALPVGEEKARLFTQAAELYAVKFKNQAEAVKAFESVLAVDPTHAQAIEFLKDSYEKRREWEKLIALRQRQATRLSGPALLAVQKEVAVLASDRVKKPGICIELWQTVLQSDPDDLDALKALSQLYEREREYEKLATVLERLVPVTDDLEERKKLLLKVGQITGDRLMDDARAAEAYRQLLVYDPEDRRYQEQLKKRYLALGKWDELEMFYAQTERWDEFIRVLESSEAKAENDAQRIGMLMKVAELWMTQKGKPDRAARAYEKVLSLDATHVPAATRLAPLYEVANNPKGLASVLEIQLDATTEPSARLDLLRRLADLYAGRANDKVKAFERRVAAFALVPEDVTAQEEAEAAASVAGKWEELVKAYRSAAAHMVDATSLRLRLGRILTEELGRIDDALKEYQAVALVDPSNDVALASLEKLYRGAGRSAELLDVYRRRIELAQSPEQRRQIQFELARLYDEALGKPADAIAAYTEVLEGNPADDEALAALDGLYGKTSAWPAQVDVLGRRIELSMDDNETLELRYRLAVLLQTKLRQPREALENYRVILGANTEHAGARAALEAMLSGADKAEAAAILEGVYEAAGQWDKLAPVLEILIGATSDPHERVELLSKLAAAGQHLEDPRAAFEAQARALREDPSRADTRARLEAFAQRSNALPALQQLYAGIAESVSEPTLAREYWLRLAGLQQHNGEVDEAAGSYERLLELDPADADVLNAMDALFRGAQRWKDLVQVYRKRIDLAADDREREQLYSEVAGILEQRLGQPELSIAAYREVLTFAPTSRLALAALDGLYVRQQRWSDLAENLEAQLEIAESDTEVTGLTFRLAELRETRMGDTQAAVLGYRAILDRDSRNGQALAALERLAQDPKNELMIAEILEPLYREQGDFEKLIAVYEIQERREPDVHVRVGLLQRIASLEEDAASNNDAAFETYLRAVAVDPTNDEAYGSAVRLARATSRFPDFIKHLETLAETQTDAELASQLLTLAARGAEEEVGDTQRAVALYRKVLTVDPVNLEAVESLQALFQGSENFEETAIILQRKAGILEDPGAQKDALFQAALIERDVLNRPERAIAVYRKILEADPEERRAMDALIELHLGLDQWTELLEIQTKKVDLAEPEDKKVILYEMGAVYERELEDSVKAIDTYQRVLELDPDDIEALGRLDVLYGAAGNWNELLGVVTQLSVLTADSEEALGYQYRVAELYEKRLDDVPRSIELYHDILNVQPGHAATLAALENIKNGTIAPLLAAAVLEPVYDGSGDYEALIGALKVQAAHAGQAYAKTEILHRIAGLYEEALNRPNDAFATYAEAVQIDPRNEESLASFERLAMVLGRFSDVASVYDAELARSTAREDRVELGMRVAQLYEVQLEDVERASQHYRQVLEVDAENVGALRALDRLYQQTERWAELVSILERQADVGETPEEILETKFRLGQVRQHQLSDVEGAITVYGEILGAAPEHTAAREALEGLFDSGAQQLRIAKVLEPLYQSAGDWEKLTQVNRAQLEHVENADERLRLIYRIAEDTEENLLDPAGAFDTYTQALLEAPLDERIGQELERLASVVDEGWVKLATSYADVVSQDGVTTTVQSALGLRLARIYEEELADPDKAKESYRFVLGVDPDNQVALENLDRIYTSFEEWPELAEVLEQRAVAGRNRDSQLEFLTRLGQIYEERVGRAEDAERVYRKVFDELSPNEETAGKALERLFASRGAWKELSKVYAAQLEASAGDVEEAEVRAKMARLSWQHLGEIEGAIAGWKRVLELRGEDGEALQGLADLYEHRQQWAELVDVLERHYEAADNDDERVLALSRRAALFSERLGRDDEALETWQRVLDIDFSNARALSAVADIWRRRGDQRELVASLHQLVERAGPTLSNEQLVAAYRELGTIYGTQLEQPFEAADAWNHLLEVESTNLEAIAALEGIYRADEQWREVVRVKYARAEALSEPAEKVRELLEVTELWQSKLVNYDGASEAFSRILGVEPLHDVAFAELEKLHKAAGRWDSLVEMYLARLEHVEEPSIRTDLWRRMARVFEERLEDNEQAFVALDQAFKEDFHDTTTAAYLGRMAHATGRWKEVIADTQALLEQQTEPNDRIRLCLCLGKWYGEDLGLMEYANAYYAQVVQLDPGNVQVLRQMANIYRLSGNWPKATETLRQAEQAAVKNEDRKMVYVDLGELLRKHVGETEQGLSYYKRALAVDGHLLPALDALDAIYTEQGDHAELASVLKKKVEAITNQDDLVSTQLRLADLYERRLDNAEKAAESYRAVVSLDATNLNALRGLVRVSEQLKRWNDLVEVLEKELICVQSERERVEVLLKIARLQEEQFLKSDVAAQRLEQALQIDPGERQAYEALARCYRRLKQWDKLVDTQRRAMAEAQDAVEKPRLLGEIAQVYAEDLNNPEEAIEAYRELLELDPSNVAALDALAKLYDKRGDTHDSIECLTRVADLTTDGAQRVDMYFRIGRQQLERLGDAIDARESFERALDLDPGHLPTLTALRTLALREEDWDSAARYLEQEQQKTDSPRARAKLLVELGKVRGERLGEEGLAFQAFEEAIQHDPECEEAAVPLVAHYVEQGNWSTAKPLVELLVRRARGQDRAEQHRLNNLLGKVHAAEEHFDEALKAYQAAFQFDVTSQESIRGIAEASFRLQDWPTALTNYQKVLTALSEVETLERTEVYYRLGCIKREQGQLKQAVNNFEKALALNGEHRPTLDALVDVYERQQEWPQVAEYKRQILDSVTDEQERYTLLLEIGDVWAKRAEEPHRAVDALEEALSLRPNDHVLLHRLLQLHQKVEDWTRVVETIAAIAALEQDAEKKARYSFTMAQLYRDKIEDTDRAVALFNEALDLNPGYLEAFERINKILTAAKDWKQLERNYRKMLHRIAGKGKLDLEHELWYQLGLVYRDRVLDREKAIDAFKMASHTRPDDPKDRRILSELFEVSERYDEAIEQQRLVLLADPLKLEPYRALYRLYLYKRAYDEAWCTAAAMAFMRKADQEEQRFFEDYRPQGILPVKGRLGNEHWPKLLFHPDLNVFVSKIFEAISGAALKAKLAQLGPTHKGPDKKYKQDVATSTITFARTFGWSSQVLFVPMPELYVRNDQPGALTALVSEPRASEAGKNVLSGFSPQELAFVCGKHLAGYRPELYIRNLFPAQSELTVMLFAAIAIAEPGTPMPQEIASNVRATAQVLNQFLEAQARDYLRAVVKRFLQEGAKVNIKHWLIGAEITACRAALLISGDLEIAKKILSSEAPTPEVTAAEKMKDLLAFSVSPDYSALRRALGVNIPAE